MILIGQSSREKVLMITANFIYRQNGVKEKKLFL